MHIIENWPTAAIAAGRIGLASLFLLGGLNKILNYGQVLEQMSGAGLPLPTLLLPCVILLEVVGGLAVAIGRRLVVPSALALALFTSAANAVFHDFWNMTGALAQLELALFFKNVSIAGALILLAGWTQMERSS